MNIFIFGHILQAGLAALAVVVLHRRGLAGEGKRVAEFLLFYSIAMSTLALIRPGGVGVVMGLAFFAFYGTQLLWAVLVATDGEPSFKPLTACIVLSTGWFALMRPGLPLVGAFFFGFSTGMLCYATTAGLFRRSANPVLQRARMALSVLWMAQVFDLAFTWSAARVVSGPLIDLIGAAAISTALLWICIDFLRFSPNDLNLPRWHTEGMFDTDPTGEVVALHSKAVR